MLKTYLKNIYEVARQGDAREESYYSSLENLLINFSKTIGKNQIHITTLPKKTEAGNPDFRIWDGHQHIIGYIEAKQPTNEDLDQIENSEQLQRYRHTFPNLILTNFLEFRFYRNGNLVERVQIGRPFIIHQLKSVPPVEKQAEFITLLEKFYSFSLPRAYDARNLATELAKRTRFLRDEVIAQELKEEENKGKENVLGFYKAFQQFLISGLTHEDFADLYSQTITYGLFAARTRSENDFNRKNAYDNIPNTIGILRDVFRFISLGELPAQMEWIVDDISEVLSVADVKGILQKYFHEGKGKDPILHFYETFLAEYDPTQREKRGVYYTPEPVVGYIVRSLHEILKDNFNKTDGFASSSITVLDPAAGTLTFPAEAAKIAINEFTEKYGEGGKNKLIREHILNNFYAFELMMAPYAVGHLKMAFLLEELGFKLEKTDRFKLYLTNTLEMEELEKTSLPGMISLSEESHFAGKVKNEQPILVIMGNPPYSGLSSNLSEKEVTIKKGYDYVTHYEIRTDKKRNCNILVRHNNKAKKEIRIKQKTWIGELIEYYKIVDGQWFGERKHWLNDDYVKFIRFAQWKIDQAGEGIIGLITNHSYMDNPTFRGMRQSLMNSFDEIRILDLHGSSLKREKCSDGSKDENVFDIQQGVAIALFIKEKVKKEPCKVYHAEIWGTREDKYSWLEKHESKTTEWKELSPKSPLYFFWPRDERGLAKYDKFIKISDIFPSNVTGIVTARDHFVIDFKMESLKAKILTFRDKTLPDDLVMSGLNLKENYMWRVSKARKALMADANWLEYFTNILYRPFDIRNIFYHDSVVWRPRKEIMRHMLQENIGLITDREVNGGFRHVFCTDKLITDCTVSSETRERSYLFPLYLYPDTDRHDLFSSNESKEKKPNINPKVIVSLKTIYKRATSPESLFYYIYGILYAPTYRKKYAEFLKSDFPRIPFAANHSIFSEIAMLGEQLVELHLLKSKILEKPIARLQGKGQNRIEKLRYDEKINRIYINGEQYFEGIEENIWKYQVGGYQVCAKWLKDRNKEILSLDDIKHYCKIVTALRETINIQNKINELYPDVEKALITI